LIYISTFLHLIGHLGAYFSLLAAGSLCISLLTYFDTTVGGLFSSEMEKGSLEPGQGWTHSIFCSICLAVAGSEFLGGQQAPAGWLIPHACGANRLG